MTSERRFCTHRSPGSPVRREDELPGIPGETGEDRNPNRDGNFMKGHGRIRSGGENVRRCTSGPGNVWPPSSLLLTT